MADENKKADESKENKSKKTANLSNRMKEIESLAIRNKQAQTIDELGKENKALKDRLGRKNNSKSSTKIAGLATLGSKPTLPS
jgi:hypothetical protein